MTFLLDVNVLIALLDVDHIDHDRVTDWFERVGHRAWATCPIVENGVVRILGSANYASVPFNYAEVAETLREWCGAEGHEFWPDEISLISDSRVAQAGLISPARITDTYLLALAAHRGARLATLDRRLSSEGVDGGSAALHLIA